MPAFNFIKDQETIDVILNGKTYPVIKTGNGPACLFICLGTPSLHTISKNFTDHFTVYSSDVYWIEENCLDNPELITIENIIDDIKILAEALHLKKYILFAHSAYGIVALEFAKKYPTAAAGIIMVGTPINSNQTVAEQNDAIFYQQADAMRQEIDKQRQAEFSKTDLSKLTPEQQWLYSYTFRQAPRYWHDPIFDCTELWKDIHLDKLLGYLFNNILPNVNALEHLEDIKTPIFLAAGASDFDCCPWLWETVSNLPANFVISHFKQSGHWPHYEEAELFDERVVEWARGNFII